MSGRRTQLMLILNQVERIRVVTKVSSPLDAANICREASLPMNWLPAISLVVLILHISIELEASEHSLFNIKELINRLPDQKSSTAQRNTVQTKKVSEMKLTSVIVILCAHQVLCQSSSPVRNRAAAARDSPAPGAPPNNAMTVIDPNAFNNLINMINNIISNLLNNRRPVVSQPNQAQPTSAPAWSIFNPFQSSQPWNPFQTFAPPTSNVAAPVGPIPQLPQLPLQPNYPAQNSPIPQRGNAAPAKPNNRIDEAEPDQ